MLKEGMTRSKPPSSSPANKIDIDISHIMHASCPIDLPPVSAQRSRSTATTYRDAYPRQSVHYTRAEKWKISLDDLVSGNHTDRSTGLRPQNLSPKSEAAPPMRSTRRVRVHLLCAEAHVMSKQLVHSHDWFFAEYGVLGTRDPPTQPPLRCPASPPKRRVVSNPRGAGAPSRRKRIVSAWLQPVKQQASGASILCRATSA